MKLSYKLKSIKKRSRFYDTLQLFHINIVYNVPHNAISDTTLPQNKILHHISQNQYRTQQRHHVSPEENNFNILGLNFDCRLTISDAITNVVVEMWWRIKAIMQARRFHSTATMVHMYKVKVLSYAKYNSATIDNDCDTAMSLLNKLQNSFLT